MKGVLLIGFWLVFGFAYSQSGKVEVIRDPRLDILVKKQGTPVPPASTPQITGYRLQLFFDSDRKKVDEARSRFVSQFPKVDTYIIYNAPNYILKAGDYRTHQEADKLKDQVVSGFPTCFVVKELINLPRIDQ